MRKIGEADVRILIVVVIAFFVLFMVFNGFGDKIKQVSLPIKLIPDFNFTSSGGNAMIAIDLTKNEDLQYYNGEKMIKIDSGDGAFTLGSYEFNPDEVKQALGDFYFNTKRKPEQFNLEINGWRYWRVYQDTSFIIVDPHTKNGFIGSKSTYDGNFAVFDANIPYNSLDNSKRGGGSYILWFESFDSYKSSPIFSKLITWRDSILEGGKCEKFIPLSLMKDGVQETKNYNVRKVDRYLLVDLNDPVYEGKKEDYNDGCSGIENYEDNEKIVDDKIPITLSYTKNRWENEDEKASLIYSESPIPRFEWSYSRLKRGEYVVYFNHFEYSNFYDEFIKYLTNSNGYFDKKMISFNYGGREDQGIFIGGSSKSINLDFIKGKEFQNPDANERNKFIYTVLTEYYSKYKVTQGTP